MTTELERAQEFRRKVLEGPFAEAFGAPIEMPDIGEPNQDDIDTMPANERPSSPCLDFYLTDGSTLGCTAAELRDVFSLTHTKQGVPVLDAMRGDLNFTIAKLADHLMWPPDDPELMALAVALSGVESEVEP